MNDAKILQILLDPLKDDVSTKSGKNGNRFILGSIEITRAEFRYQVTCNILDIVALITFFRELSGFAKQFAVAEIDGFAKSVHLVTGIIDNILAQPRNRPR
jgi:hypothetical protein